MKDTVLERWLEREGVSFEYHDVTRTDIIMDDDTKLNIRLTTSLDKEVVQDYALALQHGAEFPAIVVVKVQRNGGWRLVNGLHRLAAYEREGYDVIDAYELKTTEAVVIDRIARSVNRIAGKRLSFEEAIEQALYLINHDGYSAHDAAAVMLIAETTLINRVTAMKVTEKLVAAGVDVEGLALNALIALNTLPRESHLVRIGKLARSGRFSIETIRQLVTEVKACGSDAEGDSVIERWERDYEQRIALAGGGRYAPPVSPLRAVNNYLAQARRVSGKDTLDKISRLTGDDEIREAVGFLRETAKHLTKYAADLEKMLDARLRSEA